MPNTIANATIELSESHLQFYYRDIHKELTLTENDFQDMSGWIADYRMEMKKGGDADLLLSIGRGMFRWLNKGHNALDLIRDGVVDGPFILEFLVDKNRLSKNEKLFLEAPWELLADDDGHLMADELLSFLPARRIGKRSVSAPPSEYRLSTLFMAADPRGNTSPLDYEAEETAVIGATENIGMDLFVEDSGSLEQLSKYLPFAAADVVHISCHGGFLPEPKLFLEDESGDKAPAGPRDLEEALGDHKPGLLLLSACETASPGREDQDGLADSFALNMILRGCPAVVGWSGSVRDREATRFASKLFGRLAVPNSLETSLLYARRVLLKPEKGAVFFKDAGDWHLARLWLGPRGGGKLCLGKRPRRLDSHDRGHREFLDPKNQRVPVAKHREFVGRRRQLQAILREFRNPKHAGVLIRGFGGQGKSSLAARVANRMQGYKTVVIFGGPDELRKYSAPAILQALRNAYAVTEIMNIVDTHLPDARQNKSMLLPALRKLLEGPLSGSGEGADPVLLVIDDLEKILQKPTGNGFYTVHKDYASSMSAVVSAFAGAKTRSRLLITGRYQFTLLSDDGYELFDRLLDVHLPNMEKYESKKQAAAKIKVAPAFEIVEAPHETKRLMEDVITAGRGNPRLQDILFRLALHSPETCRRAMKNLTEYRIDEDASLGNEELQEFLENLLMRELVGLLDPHEQQLLQASTLFDLPVPMDVFTMLGAEEKHIERLKSLTFWEPFEDLVDPTKTAIAANAVARVLAFIPGDQPEKEKDEWRINPLNHEARVTLAKHVLPKLCECWGGKESGRKRPPQAQWQLAVLAVLAEDSEILRETAGESVKWLEDEFQYVKAADLAEKSIAVIENDNSVVPDLLYMYANQVLVSVGRIEPAKKLIEKAINLMREKKADNEDVSDFDLASALWRQGKLLVDSGEIDTALDAFMEAKDLFKAGNYEKDQAIVKGAIARIRVDKGQVDEALKLHEEMILVFEALGDLRSRAVTLGDIARIRVDKGQVDEALKLHEEMILVFEALGDLRSRAVTLGDIARIRVDKGQVDEALKLHEEEMKVYEALGDLRSRAVTLGDIARIRVDKGQVDEALKLHEERILVFEALGDLRSRAVTLGDIARIRVSKGQVDEALKLHEEILQIYEKLGDVVGIANVLFDKGQIQYQQKAIQEAYECFNKSYEILTRIGRLDGICFVGMYLGMILCGAGQKESGLPILKRSYDGFIQLGQEAMASQVAMIMEQFEE